MSVTIKNKQINKNNLLTVKENKKERRDLMIQNLKNRVIGLT